MHALSKAAVGQRRGGAIDCRLMACGELLARGPVCDHAGSHSFILRAKHISGSAFEEVDWRNRVTRAWLCRSQVPIWQREYWDRQLRRSESYAEKWQYVRNNPIRHGYVRRAEDWPYQGELNSLEWHDR